VGVDEEPDPRWSLANERTLLAYQRTALALLAGGVAAAGSREAVDAPAWVYLAGIPLLILSVLVALTSRQRFTATESALRSGDPLPRPPLVAVLPMSIGLVGAAVLAAVLVDLL